jgi:hypothetical protein
MDCLCSGEAAALALSVEVNVHLTHLFAKYMQRFEQSSSSGGMQSCTGNSTVILSCSARANNAVGTIIAFF